MDVHVGKRVLVPLQVGPKSEGEMVEGTVTKVGAAKGSTPARVQVRVSPYQSYVRTIDQLEEIPSPSTTVPLKRVVALRDALVRDLRVLDEIGADGLPGHPWRPEVLENSPESIVVTAPDGSRWMIWCEAVV